MKLKKALALALALACIFTMLLSCSPSQKEESTGTEESSAEPQQTESSDNETENTDENEDEKKPLTPDVTLKNLGVDLNAAGISNGKFEGDTTNADFTVTYISGTENAYSYDDSTKTLTFKSLSADSAYSISGKLNGNIVINAGDSFKLDLRLDGFALRSASETPISVISAKEITLSAKSNTKSYIYDERNAVSGADAQPSSIYSKADLTLCGDGELFVQSAKNNGIESSKNLLVTDISLVVECNNDALKGNNAVTLKNCSTLLVAKSGDAIKTIATDISETTNQQNGIASILGGTHNIFASNDGIESAYDVVIDYGSITDEATKEAKIVDTILNIFTDTYSSYTDAAAHDNPDSEIRPLYVCNTSADYKYSVKLSNADGTKSEWVNPKIHEEIKTSRRTYYTYKFFAKPEYTKMTVFIYSTEQAQENEEAYVVKSNLVDIPESSNTYRYSNRRWDWRTYESLTQSGGNNNASANPNAVSYSATGIRGANSVTVKAGTIKISAVGNAISTNNQVPTDNQKIPLGDVTLNGGDITLISKDSGLFANGTVTLNDGSIKILDSYDGINGNIINVNGGNVSVTSANNGFNATAKSGTGITVAGGTTYVCAGAHGISSSSSASYSAILFNGGDMVLIATAAKKSPIYSDGGYKYVGGRILAIMSIEGTRANATHYYSFSSIGTFEEIELAESSYLTTVMDDEPIVSTKISNALSAIVIYLGDKSVEFSTNSIEGAEYVNGIYWN